MHTLPTSTDPFEVGDRVLANERLLGRVNFIGKTQFAAGEWVGISLDHPDGKNNGSVQGVQYFRCPRNHGLFTQPELLTLVKESDADLKTPQENLKPGDYVIVGGIKKNGTVRFVGSTEFAEGIWVGVELYEPIGKNDGAVSGIR